MAGIEWCNIHGAMDPNSRGLQDALEEASNRIHILESALAHSNRHAAHVLTSNPYATRDGQRPGAASPNQAELEQTRRKLKKLSRRIKGQLNDEGGDGSPVRVQINYNSTSPGSPVTVQEMDEADDKSGVLIAEAMLAAKQSLWEILNSVHDTPLRDSWQQYDWARLIEQLSDEVRRLKKNHVGVLAEIDDVSERLRRAEHERDVLMSETEAQTKLIGSTLKKARAEQEVSLEKLQEIEKQSLDTEKRYHDAVTAQEQAERRLQEVQTVYDFVKDENASLKERLERLEGSAERAGALEAQLREAQGYHEDSERMQKTREQTLAETIVTLNEKMRTEEEKYATTLSAANRNYSQELGEMRNSMNALNKERMEREAQLRSEHDKVVDELRRECNHLKSSLHTTTRDLEAERNRASMSSDQMKANEDHYKKLLADLDEALRTCRKEVDSAQHSLSQSEMRCTSLDRTVEQLRHEAKKNEEDINSLRDALRRSREKADAQAADLDAARRSNDSLQHALETTKAVGGQQDRDLERKEGELARVRTELASVTTERNNLVSEKAAAEKDSRDLQGQVAALRKEVADKHQSIGELLQKHEEERQQHASALAQRATSAEELQVKLSAAQAEISSAQDRAGLLESERSSFQRQVEHLQEIVRRVGDEKDKAVMEWTAASSELTGLRGKLETAGSEREYYSSQVAQLQDSCRRIAEEKDRSIMELTRRVHEVNEREAVLRDEQERAQKARADAERMQTLLGEQLDKLGQSSAEATVREAGLHEEINRLDADNKRLKFTVDNLSTEAEGLKRDYGSLHKECNRLTNELREVTERCHAAERLSSERENVEGSLRQVTTDYQEARHRAETSSQALAELEERTKVMKRNHEDTELLLATEKKRRLKSEGDVETLRDQLMRLEATMNERLRSKDTEISQAKQQMEVCQEEAAAAKARMHELEAELMEAEGDADREKDERDSHQRRLQEVRAQYDEQREAYSKQLAGIRGAMRQAQVEFKVHIDDYQRREAELIACVKESRAIIGNYERLSDSFRRDSQELESMVNRLKDSVEGVSSKGRPGELSVWLSQCKAIKTHLSVMEGNRQSEHTRQDQLIRQLERHPAVSNTPVSSRASNAVGFTPSHANAPSPTRNLFASMSPVSTT